MPTADANRIRIHSIPGSRLQTFTGGHLFFLIRDRQRLVDAVATFIGQA